MRAAMWKYMSYLIHNLRIIEHFLSFNDQNFEFYLLERVSRAAGRVFETPVLKGSLVNASYFYDKIIVN